MKPERLNSDEHREYLRRFLLAWRDAIGFQSRILNELAITLNIERSRIYYHWVKPPHCAPHGFIRDTSWSFVFHGFADCDLKHEDDARFLQVSFGPNGCFDIFSAWGTLQYIMGSKPPWPNYPLLKRYFAAKSPPYNHLSGSYSQLRRLTAPLKKLGLFATVDRDLLRLKSDLRIRHTRTDADGRRIYEPPDPYNDPEQDIFWDLEVAHAQKLSALGQTLMASDLDEDEFAALWADRGGEGLINDVTVDPRLSQLDLLFPPR